jgi:PHS family inorganic phosphate transporter-like MFS transporter
VGTGLAFCTLMAFLWLPGMEDKKGKRPPENVGRILRVHAAGLLGTCGGWFLFDIMFYANGLFSALVMEDVLGKATSPSAIMRQSLTLSVLPLAGFAVAGLYIARSRWSLRTLQLAGFAAMTALYLGLSLGYEAVRTAPALFITLYAMTFLFANAGPNSTTFILPTVVFRSHTATCHGLSAAAGKLGAMVGTAGMAPLLHRYGPPVVFSVCAVVGVLGLIVTALGIPADTAAPSEEKEEEMEPDDGRWGRGGDPERLPSTPL